MNIVKDDLIVKVDELTGEIEILREELNTANQSRSKLRQKVSELEDELKQNKTLAKAHGKSFVECRLNFFPVHGFVLLLAHSDQEDEGDVPMAQRKRFTRVEMARVLMERNQVNCIESKWQMVTCELIFMTRFPFPVQRTFHGTARSGTMD